MESVGLPELIKEYESKQHPFAEPLKSLMDQLEAEFIANKATVSIEPFQTCFETIKRTTLDKLNDEAEAMLLAHSQSKKKLKDVASIFGLELSL